MYFLQAHSNNYAKGRNSAIQYIVIHYTANRGDTAKNNLSYFSRVLPINATTGKPRQASAHYFIDENEVCQSVRDTDTAYSVGDGNGKYGITNSNSLSIEMCNSLTFNAKVEERTIEFAKEMKRKYPNAKIVRHYDASRKTCPAYYVNNPQAWSNFVAKVGQTTAPTPPTPQPTKKTNEQIAREVIAGKWGNGENRKNALTKAGYNFTAIQAEVNRLLGQKPTPAPKPTKKSNEQIASEVIKGLWGNGADRTARLTKAGYDPKAIQAIVNKKLK